MGALLVRLVISLCGWGMSKELMADYSSSHLVVEMAGEVSEIFRNSLINLDTLRGEVIKLVLEWSPDDSNDWD